MNILIYGLGISGKSALKYSKTMGFNTYVMNQGTVDSWYDESLGVSRDHCFEECSNLDLKIGKVILSPGIPRSKVSVTQFIKKKIDVICDVEFIFGDFKDAKLISITGTNGKTTTADMIFQYLKAHNHNCFLGGNIGIPVCDYVKSDIVILELSSYQLESIKKFRSDVSILTNLSANHLDRYSDDFNLYKKAKLNITSNLAGADTFIYHESLDNYDDSKKNYYHCVNDLKLNTFKNQFTFNYTKVKGNHNVENFLMAYLAIKNIGVKVDHDSFQEFISSYVGVEHRLEFVGRFADLEVFNDSKSTNILATTTALESFDNDVYLILGGVNKKVSFIKELTKFKHIKQIYLVGESTEFLTKDLSGLNTVICQSLEEVLEQVGNLNGSLVFSPGHQSFDQYKNFVERGNKFKELVFKKL
jgi:UDP-N-acetylmuramoylalanine--D-glutamate ligase